MQEAPSELEAFIDESIRLAGERGYRPTGFIQMRDRYGTMGAITRLVTGDVKPGLIRMIKLGLADRTIDFAAAEKFSEYFPKKVQEAAAWRLSEAKKEARKGVGKT